MECKQTRLYYLRSSEIEDKVTILSTIQIKIRNYSSFLLFSLALHITRLLRWQKTEASSRPLIIY